HWWPRAWDRGNTITQAVGAASRGKDAHESLRLAEESASRTSQSNGGLMRISPLAIFASGRLDQAIGLARDECRLTHPHPVCQDACAAYVAAVSTAIANGGTPREIHAAALHAARQNAFQPAVVAALENAAHARPADYHSQMGWVLIALQNSFFQLLNAPNLEEGVADTVIQGGDTDTNAAIAGALLGAVHGRPAVPHCWILALLSCRTLPSTPTRHPQPPEYWPVDALQLAEALLCAGRSDH
ncbi:MAG: ADP-ribosylglycohydrolase family protein, partial [Pirellulales bacterium]